MFDLIVTRSDKVVAQRNNPPRQNRQTMNPPGGRTKVVAQSDKLENSSQLLRVVVRSDKVVARSDNLVMVASINFPDVARSDKPVFRVSRGEK
jgi:hypothetical protein